MIYADSDFFLALAKKEDWLKKGAQSVHDRYKGDIATSIAAVIEIALVAKMKGVEDIEDAISSVFEISSVEGMTVEEGMEVAHLIKDENFGVFDAFHAVLSKDMPIASSEHIYDKIGRERIKLES